MEASWARLMREALSGRGANILNRSKLRVTLGIIHPTVDVDLVVIQEVVVAKAALHHPSLMVSDTRADSPEFSGKGICPWRVNG